MQRKLLALPILAILALSMIGFAYTQFSETLLITGTADTGDLTLIIIPLSPSDTDSGTDPGKGRDVGDTTIEIDPTNPQKAILTITNAYPSYEVIWHVTIKNVGTIPAILQKIKVTAPDCIEATASNGLGTQLNPESQEAVSGWIHVTQSADEDTTYTVTVEFVYVQWNQYQ